MGISSTAAINCPCKCRARQSRANTRLGGGGSPLGSSLGISSTAATNCPCKCRARQSRANTRLDCGGTPPDGVRPLCSSLGISSTAATNFPCKCRARLAERLRVLGAAARRSVAHWEFLRPRQQTALANVERGKAERIRVLSCAVTHRFECLLGSCEFIF